MCPHWRLAVNGGWVIETSSNHASISGNSMITFKVWLSVAFSWYHSKSTQKCVQSVVSNEWLPKHCDINKLRFYFRKFTNYFRKLKKNERNRNFYQFRWWRYGTGRQMFSLVPNFILQALICGQLILLLWLFFGNNDLAMLLYIVHHVSALVMLDH